MARNSPPHSQVVRRGPASGPSTPKSRQAEAEHTTQKKQGAGPSSVSGDTKALAKSAVPAILLWTFILSLIFGGCCSNVYALEDIIKDEPDSGLLITFFQFLLVTVVALPSHLSLKNPPLFLKPRAVPLRRWIPSVLLFFVINMMNNYAFGFKISVPVHIILRSGGSVATLLVGWVWGKRYSRGQIVGVILLTIGVIVAAMADAQSKGKLSGISGASDLADFNAGLIILFVAQVLSAIMGVYVQNTYAIYGSHWRENLFYSHILSLPLFAFFGPSLYRQFQRLINSPPLALHIPYVDFQRNVVPQLSLLWNHTADSGAKARDFAVFTVPTHVFTLGLNAVTQYACIRGVNLLGARTTALGVTIVLNLRKLVSLFLSIWIFGNQLSFGVMIGATIVFLGAGVYAWGGTGKSRGSSTAGKKAKAA